jgi:hypothetical protein
MNRRTFLESSVATAFFASLPGKTFAATHQIEKVGLQLYTVRDFMKSDFEGTIAKVAAAAYKEVEFAGLFNHSPKGVRAILDKDGLTAPSCHVGYDVVEKQWPETIEAAKIMGQTFIVCPGIPDAQRKQPDGYKRVAEPRARLASSSPITITVGSFSQSQCWATSAHLIFCSIPRTRNSATWKWT